MANQTGLEENLASQEVDRNKKSQNSFHKFNVNDGKNNKDVNKIYHIDSSSEEDIEMIVSTAPDGGWAWVVCTGSFVVNFILDGTLFSFGILMLALLDDLGYDKYTTAWIGSAQMGIHMAMGPVISIILQFYSIRQVAIVGTIISATGFIASAFAPNIYVLIFTYGVIGGVGIGMVFLPSIIVVGLYFTKKRAIATGIATSGSGVGTFVYGYITNRLLGSYGWRGTVFILGGIILNCSVCAMCFRPLSLRTSHRKQEKKMDDAIISDASKPLIKDGSFPTVELESTHEKTKQDGSVISSGGTGDSAPRQTPAASSGDSGMKLRAHLVTDDSNRSECLGERLKPAARNLVDDSLSHSVRNAKAFTARPSSCFDKCSFSVTGRSLINTQSEVSPDLPWRTTLNRRYHSSDYIQLIGAHSEKTWARCTKGCASSLPRLNVQSDPWYKQPIQEDSESNGSVKFGNNTASPVHCDQVPQHSLFMLLTNRVFLLLLLTFTMWTAQSISLTYIPDLAVSLGIHQSDAAFLISIIGIANVLGRLLAGFITDCCSVPSIWLYSVALVIAAGVNLIIAFNPLFSWSSLAVLQMCCAVFGLCMAIAVSMRTIVLVDQLGIEALTVSFGVVALFQGVAFSLNPPIAGQLIEDFNSFIPPFVMASIMYAVSAVATVAVGCLNGRQSHLGRI